MLFADRTDAGRRLGAALDHYRGDPSAVLLALPRGGVPVAAEAARALELPLGLLLVRKVGAPNRPELALGAVAADGVRVIDNDLVRTLGVTAEQLEAAVERAEQELRRRHERYQHVRRSSELAGRNVILVDDGAATGSTMLAAVQVARAHEPAHVVVALPSASAEARQRLSSVADELVCLDTPAVYRSVSSSYRTFDQVQDDEVVAELAALADRERTRDERER